MPKISRESIRINADETDERFDFDIHYARDYGFYAEIPPGFNDVFDELNEEQLKKYSAARKYKYKYNHGAHKRVVLCETEMGVADAMKKLVSGLLLLTIKKEAVIIVDFTDHTDTHDNTNDFPAVGLELSIVYCHRVTAGGKDPKYYKYSTSDWFGKDKTVRQQINVGGYRNQSTIIDDTPENRKFLEDIHGALDILVKKMAEFTGSSESMLKMIASRQKLLENSPLSRIV
jgi:hypothetical protein